MNSYRKNSQFLQLLSKSANEELVNAGLRPFENLCPRCSLEPSAELTLELLITGRLRDDNPGSAK